MSETSRFLNEQTGFLLENLDGSINVTGIAKFAQAMVDRHGKRVVCELCLAGQLICTDYRIPGKCILVHGENSNA